MGGNLRLHEDRRLLRVQASCQVQGRHLLAAFPQGLGILRNRDGVLVYDAENRLVVVLDFRPVAQRTQVVADVQRAGGLHARKDPRLHVWTGIFHSIACPPMVSGLEPRDSAGAAGAGPPADSPTDSASNIPAGRARRTPNRAISERASAPESDAMPTIGAAHRNRRPRRVQPALRSPDVE